MSHLSHYSASVRYDALTGLRELFRLHPTEIAKRVASLLERMCAIICDSDVAVRHALIGVFRDIFLHISSTRMTPFFAVIVAHVTGGLSHIHSDVRVDALQILDSLRENYPSLIVPSLPKIVPHLVGFLRQNASGVEKRIRHGSAKGIASDRLQLLSRLQAFLHLSLTGDQPDPSHRSKWAEVSLTTPTHVGLYKFGLPGQNVQMSTSTTPCTDVKGLDAGAVRHIVTSVVPVLLEWWVECEPSRLSSESPVQPQALMTMSLVLDLIQTLWKHAAQADQRSDVSELGTFLSSRYEKEFVKHFLTYFPFTATKQTSGYKKAMEKLGIRGARIASVVDMNATLCSVMATVKCNDSVWVGQITDYLVDLISSESQIHQLSPSAFKTLLATIRQLLEDDMYKSDSVAEDRLTDTVSQLLYGLVSLFKSSHALTSKKECLLGFLVSVFLQSDLADRLRDRFVYVYQLVCQCGYLPSNFQMVWLFPFGASVVGFFATLSLGAADSQYWTN